jgi:hypothetical protein
VQAGAVGILREHGRVVLAGLTGYQPTDEPHWNEFHLDDPLRCLMRSVSNVSSSSYSWNNDGDTATLKASNGTVASRCSCIGAGSCEIC